MHVRIITCAGVPAAICGSPRARFLSRPPTRWALNFETRRVPHGSLRRGYRMRPLPRRWIRDDAERRIAKERSCLFLFPHYGILASVQRSMLPVMPTRYRGCGTLLVRPLRRSSIRWSRLSWGDLPVPAFGIFASLKAPAVSVEPGTECAICLETDPAGSGAWKALPCNHAFHEDWRQGFSYMGQMGW